MSVTTCPKCKGKGVYPSETTPDAVNICEKCNGDGSIPYIPEYECTKGHTITLNGYCDLMNCRDYTPEAGNVCAYLRQPKKPATIPHIIKEGSREHVISYSTQGRHCSEPNCEVNFENEPATCPVKARIKDGAFVGCDFHVIQWKDNGEVFEVVDFTKERKKLTALGYGKKESYGNGALYVKPEDLIPADLKSAERAITHEERVDLSNQAFAKFKPEPAEPLFKGIEERWDFTKNLDDFQDLAFNLYKEGHASRADAVTYLIERCKRVEFKPIPKVEPQAEMMPLIDNKYKHDFEPYGVAHKNCWQEAIEAQRGADMAWLPVHDQQVATAVVKEFVKECEKKIAKNKTYGGNEQSTSYNRGLRVASEIIRSMVMRRSTSERKVSKRQDK
jgi:hypothetical protein